LRHGVTWEHIDYVIFGSCVGDGEEVIYMNGQIVFWDGLAFLCIGLFMLSWKDMKERWGKYLVVDIW